MAIKDEWDQAHVDKEDWLDQKHRLEVCAKLREALEEQQRVVAENTDIKAITHWNRQVEYYTRILEQGDKGSK